MSGNQRSTNGTNDWSGSGDQGVSVTKIFIGRDYLEGTMVKFQTKFPPELDGIIDRQHFEYFISTLNEMYYHAETSSAGYVESCFACLSSYLLYFCIETHYAKCMKKVAMFIDEQNEAIWQPRGVHITDPIERGLRVIEIAIKVEGNRSNNQKTNAIAGSGVTSTSTTTTTTTAATVSTNTTATSEPKGTKSSTSIKSS